MGFSREQFLALRPSITDVPAPQLGPGSVVHVREPDALMYQKLVDADYPPGKDGVPTYQPKGQMARWAIACIVADGGQPLLRAEDAAVLDSLPGPLLAEIVRTAKGVASSVEDEAGN